jgi:hypothetical protein
MHYTAQMNLRLQSATGLGKESGHAAWSLGHSSIPWCVVRTLNRASTENLKSTAGKVMTQY